MADGTSKDPIASDLKELREHYRSTMAKGSKSFSLASLLFEKEEKEAAQHLYSWCRFCDDQVDNAQDSQQARERLESLRAETIASFIGDKIQEPAFLAFGELSRKYKIPELYPLELLNGMQMDVDGYRYKTATDLRLYCYRVAGVVGLMMVHVMGVSSPRALRHALDTGLAMQMTNIARDIAEDFAMKRIYIPEEWFEAVGKKVPSLEGEFNPQDFTEVVKKLILLADQLYASGRMGLKYLPFRAALAVSAAQEIYREIGFLVVEKGPDAWRQRAVVSMPRKLLRMSVAFARVFATIPGRLLRPWKRAPLDEVWGPETLH